MSEFSHLKNKLLAEQVEDQIYHFILDTPIEPGSKLPNEFALGEKFRVGRSTIREAIKLLSSKGIVEVRQGSGTYVVTTVKGLSDPLNLRSVQDKNALAFDLVNVRLLLEPGIAEMAAQNATPEDIERLRRLCERVETKIHEGDRYIEDDIAFHTCIAESSKNLVVGQLIPVIDTAVMMFVNVTHKKLIDETIMTHRMITEAIANHDPIGAKAAMVMHLNFNRSYIKKVCKTCKWMCTGGVNAKNVNNYLGYNQIIAVGGTWMCKSDKIKAGAWDEITAMSREAVDVMLGLELGHIGINCADEAEAAKTAETIANLLSMAVKVGNSSIFVGKKEFEIMKKPGRGTNGHIAILTNNVDRAIYHLGQRGVKFDMDSKNVKDGKTIAIYFADEIAGFAFHLVQR